MLEHISTLQILGWLGYLACLYKVLHPLSFNLLKTDKKIQHLVFGSAASLFCLWLFRAGIHTGLSVHFLWLTALVLVLGFRWAVVSSFIALLGVTIVGKESWAMFGVNGLLSNLIPLGLSYLIYTLAFHKLPRHFFIYIFVCAFLTGALMICVKMSLLSGYFYLNGDYDWQTIKDNYLVLALLMLFMEGMLNGMTMTLLIIYKPQWVHTFYDKFYINNK
jgi:uncharacterized membrane protein